MHSKIIFLLVLTFQFFSSNIISQEDWRKTLDNVQVNISNTQTFSYNLNYLSTNPNIEDSIYRCSGKVTGIIVQSDTVFGCHFSLKGEDKNRSYEYIYDGKTGIEVDHTNKEIMIFNPHAYPNDRRNPAKARMALIPFQELLIDKNIISTLLKDNPKITSSIDEDSTYEKIIFRYPINEFNQDYTRNIYINKSSNLIERINSILVWNGATFITKIEIDSYSINDPSIKDRVDFNYDYSNYITKKYEETIKNEVKPTKTLLGEIAPSFCYESFSGEKISLEDYKGKVVLLDFWETWCGWCIVALPKINELYKEYIDKGLKVLGITTENKEQIRKLIDKNNLLYPNIYANISILEDYKVSARPTYYLIDQTGKIDLITYGDLGKIKLRIDELLQ